MKIKKTILLLLLIIAGAALIFSAAVQWKKRPIRMCTEIGCFDGFTLILKPADMRFPEGRYDVHFTPEGKAVKSCFFVVSNDPVKCASGHCVIEENCNALYSMGYNVSDNIRILYPVTKVMLTVEVERDDVTIAKTTIEPVYRTVQPNGPSCPPTCLQGKNVLIVE